MNAHAKNIKHVHHPLLFEMIRSFVTLAKHLNLSHAVDELNSTRQTVRRHVQTLEDSMGVKLFHVEDRRYQLTEKGADSLQEANELLFRAKAWAAGHLGSTNGLQYLTVDRDGWVFFQQEQPLGRIWTDEDSLLVRETFRAWAMAGGEIENQCLNHVRPFLIIFRYTPAGWVCCEFGEESYYVLWFGQDFARSSIGRPMKRMPAGEEFASMLDEAFHQVEATQGARLDHVYTRMPSAVGGELQPVTYQRLMMGGRFPDGSPAVLSLIVPKLDVDIGGFEPQQIMGSLLQSQPKLSDVEAKFEDIVASMKQA